MTYNVFSGTLNPTHFTSHSVTGCVYVTPNYKFIPTTEQIKLLTAIQAHYPYILLVSPTGTLIPHQSASLERIHLPRQNNR